jgi:excisionase family DNA binding protein
MDGLDKLVSITEAARKKGCARTTIYRAIKDGRIKMQKVGGNPYVMLDESFQKLKLRQVEESTLKKVSGIEEKVTKLEESLKRAWEKIALLEKGKEKSGIGEKSENKIKERKEKVKR